MNGSHWTDEHQALWQRIAAHPFEVQGRALDFTRRLARDRSWPLDHARLAIEEYRRFCFLSVVQTSPVTPSEDVDEVWHTHLAYTRDYWDLWCAQVLGRRLHHDPTEGGPSEARKFREQYAQTLATYEHWFGPPPAAFWPSTQKRFAARPRFHTIDRERVIAIPRLRIPARWALVLPAAVCFPGAAMAQLSNPLDWPADSFLALFLAAVAMASLLTIVGRRLLRNTGQEVQGLRLNATETAYLAGGPNRAFATAMLEAMTGGNVSVDPSGNISVKSKDTVRGMLSRYLKDGAKYRAVRAEAQPTLVGIRQELEHRGLLLRRSRSFQSAFLPILAMAPVLLFGMAKVNIGLDRGRPVGILLFAIVVVAGGTLFATLRRPLRSRGGDACLTGMREKMARLMRAPTEAELPLALALVGTAVLIGTPYAALAMTSQSSGGDGSSGCGSDSSSGSSDSGGSSGCGGCSSSSC